MTKPIEEKYYAWLIRGVEHPFMAYYQLLRRLFLTEFVAINASDNNRIGDVAALRQEFMYESYLDELPNNHPISVLEIMITLAQRVYEIGYNPEDDKDRNDWFWVLVGNLQLNEYDDLIWDLVDPASEGKVEEILHKFVQRDYESNGSGGLFPLAYPEEDQRDVELWYQMQAWMYEITE